jgi:hypothetical protein
VAQGLKGGRRCDGYFELGELEAGCWGFLDVGGGGGSFVDTKLPVELCWRAWGFDEV